MKHRVKVKVETVKRGAFGVKHRRIEDRWITVDGPTYREIIRNRDKTYTLEELLAAEYRLLEVEWPEMFL